MSNFFTKLFYAGKDKKTLKSIEKELCLENIKSVMIYNIVFCFVFILYSLYYLDIGASPVKLVLAIVGMVFFFISFLLAIYINKKVESKYFVHISNALVSFEIVFAYSLSMILGIFENTVYPAVSIVVLVLFLQIIFNLYPLHNLLLNMPCAIIFLCISYYAKPLETFEYDTINIAVAFIIGVVLSIKKLNTTVSYYANTSRLNNMYDELYEISRIDDLTKLLNRKTIEHYYYYCLRRLEKSNKSIFCLAIDVDDFKKYNDLYGHPQGDTLLIELGKILNSFAEERKLEAGRVGGEEFLIVGLVDKGFDYISESEKLRKSVEDLHLEHKNSSTGKYATISIGVYFDEKLGDKHPYDLADIALYKSKELGKNIVTIYSEELQNKSEE